MTKSESAWCVVCITCVVILALEGASLVWQPVLRHLCGVCALIVLGTLTANTVCVTVVGFAANLVRKPIVRQVTPTFVQLARLNFASDIASTR